jgi:rhodanese-related sulfurtransferase
MNAANKMTGAGFKDVVNLEGGITSWADKGFPVAK